MDDVVADAVLHERIAAGGTAHVEIDPVTGQPCCYEQKPPEYTVTVADHSCGVNGEITVLGLDDDDLTSDDSDNLVLANSGALGSVYDN